MSNTPDLAARIAAYDGSSSMPLSCITGDDGRSELLPLSPFNALRYHFGMLLGVDDFETEQAYHRAKMRIHNAWLHRAGVVWGFGVRLDAYHGEIRVTPGLALDAAGHELHLEADACINVGDWFDKHEKDAGFDLDRERFDLHVVIRFKACLTKQVPALLEPCDNASTGTAYSRVFETIEILLQPDIAPLPVYPYHRLRLMFGVDQPGKKDGSTDNAAPDQEVLDEVARIRALPAADQNAAWWQAFHRFAALDEIDLQPATSEDGARTLLFPGRDDDFVVLANITELKLTRNAGGWDLSGGTVDTSVRPSHVATTTIQDLLCGQFLGAPESAPADTGPRVDPNSVMLLTSKAIEFRVSKDLHDASVEPVAFSVSWFDVNSGWQGVRVVTASYGGSETQTVNLELDRDVSGRVRLIAFGTGPAPLLGADLVPLAGAVGGPPGTMHNGHDFVHMHDFVEPATRSDEEGTPTEGGEAAEAVDASETSETESTRDSSEEKVIARSGLRRKTSRSKSRK